MDLLPLSMRCGADQLVGVLHQPDAPATLGVVVVVGGPQYRIGVGRQFVLLGRKLARAGMAVLRFDYRGMGDSEGRFEGFLNIGDDIRAAVDALVEHAPQVREVALWGLCDAASAILLYAHRDRRITKIVLLNPWVRSEAGRARTYLKHYYLGRLLSREFWARVARLEFDPRASVQSLVTLLGQAFGRLPGSPSPQAQDLGSSYQGEMLQALQRFKGSVLLLLSGQDLTAREFELLVADSEEWRRQIGDPRVERRALAAADHTFSRAEWRDEMMQITEDWLAKR